VDSEEGDAETEPDAAERDKYSFIGECYVHGFMNGKALE